MEFPGSDRSVVNRTQYYNYEHFNERPVQIQTYFTVRSFAYVIGTVLMAMVFAALSLFSAGRSLLEKYPKFFTFATLSTDAPSRAHIDSTRFSIKLIGKGWKKNEDDEGEGDEKEKLQENEDPNLEPAEEFNRSMTVMVSGRDPGYMATSTCIIQSGLTILKDRAKMPK